MGMNMKAIALVGMLVVVMGCAESTVTSGCVDDDYNSSVTATDSPLGAGEGGAGNAPANVCLPGEAYVCVCPNDTQNPNLGNKFCAWDGTSFGPCELCGEGPATMGPTGIPCNQTPPSSPMDPPIVDCPETGGVCWGYQCDNVTKRCVQMAFIEGSTIQDASPNDCYQPMCDGAGAVVIVPAPDDCSGTCTESGLCQ